ncbi:MAG: leucine-rich repeat protein [Clostridia bacterium]|nr:leucine-rich repeat protein [Clostridia bacterium]
MSMKKKVIIISLIFGTIILGLVATIVTVLVSMFSGMSANIKVGYMAKNVDANVTARYWTGGSGWKILGTEDGLTFNSSSNNVSGELNQLEEEIKLEDDNNRIVFEYAFNNLSESIHLNLDLITKPTATNMDVTYYVSPAQLNAVSTINPPETLDAWTSRTIEAGDTDGAYVYIVVEAIDGVRNASFKGEFEWALEVPNECAVVYDMEGVSNYSEFTGNEITLKGLPYTTVNTVPKYYASGYSFAGWYTDEARTNLFVDQTIVDENMTLYPLFYTGNVQITEEDYSEELGGYVVNDLAAVTTNSVTIRGGANSIKAAPENSIVIPDEITINGVTEPVVAMFNCTDESDPNYNKGILDKDGGVNALYIGNNVKTIPSRISGVTSDDVTNGTYNENLQTIYLGKSLTSIPSQAFIGCTELTSDIVIPESCLFIGKSAFAKCVKVSNVVLHDNIQEIQSVAFRETGIVEIVWPKNLTKIEDSVFYQCVNIINIVVPENVTIIGNSTFAFCESLISVFFEGESKLQIIDDGAFAICLNLSQIDIPKTVISLGDEAGTIGCTFKNTSIENIVVPEGVTYIPKECFSYNSKLKSVVLGENVQIVGEQAFSRCTLLENMEIPDTVTTIGAYAFYFCSALKSIEISDGVSSIGTYAFNSCTALESIKIPESVTILENNTFYGCSNLESVKLPANLLKINQQVFRNCTSLTSIEFPSTVTLVDARAFENTNLISLHIPAALTNIAATAFMSIPNLAYITVEEGNAKWEDRGCNSIVEKSSNQLRVGSLNTVVVDSIKSIGNYAFMGRSGLTSIQLHNKLNSIGDGAFSGSGITEIVIPASVTIIHRQAFQSCSKLTKVTFEDTNNWISNTVYAEVVAGNGTAIDVSDPVLNAKNFRNMSGYGAWKNLYIRKITA